MIQQREWYKNPVVNQVLGALLTLALVYLAAKFGITPTPVEIVVPPASDVKIQGNTPSVVYVRPKE